jgi:type VI secretion system secreted protein Hcp
MAVLIKEMTAKAGATNGSDIFLHVQAKRAGKIKGEATASGHTDDIVVRSWRWGLNGTAAVGSVQATGRRSYTGLSIIKQVDAATTGLMSALATNDEIKEAKLTMRKSGDGQVDYFIITLNGGRISQVEHSVDMAGDALESITILFTKVEVEYRPQQMSGLRGGSNVFNDEILPV